MLNILFIQAYDGGFGMTPGAESHGELEIVKWNFFYSGYSAAARMVLTGFSSHVTFHSIERTSITNIKQSVKTKSLSKPSSLLR
ncbi:hypothetical protein LINPERPRIM_LOCUS9639 [Linum perenne]